MWTAHIGLILAASETALYACGHDRWKRVPNGLTSGLLDDILGTGGISSQSESRPSSRFPPPMFESIRDAPHFSTQAHATPTQSTPQSAAYLPKNLAVRPHGSTLTTVENTLGILDVDPFTFVHLPVAKRAQTIALSTEPTPHHLPISDIFYIAASLPDTFSPPFDFKKGMNALSRLYISGQKKLDSKLSPPARSSTSRHCSDGY
ncbi:MAG: hypothetical protein M1831_000190 [Alyxoria varia]|nr:MAG: hypothetical protein M1831_000190 [Alyxoria varia]